MNELVLYTQLESTYTINGVTGTVPMKIRVCVHINGGLIAWTEVLVAYTVVTLHHTCTLEFCGRNETRM